MTDFLVENEGKLQKKYHNVSVILKKYHNLPIFLKNTTTFHRNLKKLHSVKFWTELYLRTLHVFLRLKYFYNSHVLHVSSSFPNSTCYLSSSASPPLHVSYSFPNSFCYLFRSPPSPPPPLSPAPPSPFKNPTLRSLLVNPAPISSFSPQKFNPLPLSIPPSSSSSSPNSPSSTIILEITLISVQYLKPPMPLLRRLQTYGTLHPPTPLPSHLCTRTDIAGSTNPTRKNKFLLRLLLSALSPSSSSSSSIYVYSFLSPDPLVGPDRLLLFRPKDLATLPPSASTTLPD